MASKLDILRSQFWATTGLFYHPRLRLLLARHIYGAINKPIQQEFIPPLKDKILSILNDLMTIDDIHHLLQVEAVKFKQDLALKHPDFPVATHLEVQKAVEALLYVFEHQLPHPIVPATQVEIQQLGLSEPLQAR